MHPAERSPSQRLALALPGDSLDTRRRELVTPATWPTLALSSRQGAHGRGERVETSGDVRGARFAAERVAGHAGAWVTLGGAALPRGRSWALGDAGGTARELGAELGADPPGGRPIGAGVLAPLPGSWPPGRGSHRSGAGQLVAGVDPGRPAPGRCSTDPPPGAALGREPRAGHRALDGAGVGRGRGANNPNYNTARTLGQPGGAAERTQYGRVPSSERARPYLLYNARLLAGMAGEPRQQ